MMYQQQPQMVMGMQTSIMYIPMMGYQMPNPACVPPPNYFVPKPDQFQSNAVWQGYYEQDGERHDMTWMSF